MPPVSWLEIRKWNGSQSDAFEELCCQLAHSEPVAPGANFVTKGRPDSGIECYWTLPNGDEWGWQAKFFFDSVTKKRWEECDESVKRALEGHPKLTKLFFCIPYKFPDSRKPNQISGAQQWVNHRTKWKQWAEERGMSTEFVLWDEHELLFRLTKPENRGRNWFWFNAPLMDADWFRKNLTATIDLANDRYTPDLHFELPLAQNFEALGRTADFLKRLNEMGAKLNKVLADLSGHLPYEKFEKESKSIEESLQAALIKINSLSLDANTSIDFKGLEKTLRVAQDLVEGLLREIGNRRWKKAEQFEKDYGRRPDPFEYYNDGFSDYRLREAHFCLTELLRFCTSEDAALTNRPAMLLVGDAGLGKTHLICSVAERRISAGLPTITLLGQQFDESEPWSQIIRLLGVSCDRDTFLGGIDANGEAAGARTLIMIDAINEGPGILFWQRHLAALLSQLSNYSHVGIVLTIRTAYFNRNSLPMEHLVLITHHGFAGVANAAVRHFFRFYGLAEPNVPVLDPEFENPLFLKLICRALKNSNRHELPNDLIGVSAIFNFVLEEIDNRLSEKLDYARSDLLVQKAVSRIAEIMAESGSEFISSKMVKQELNSIYPANGYSKSLLAQLLAEHVLVQSPGAAKGEDEQIRFAYQRLSDHLIVRAVLARTPKRSLRGLFHSQGIFGRRMGDGSWFYGIAGWLQALATQLPEKYGLEVNQVLRASLIDNSVLRRAFLSSLIWRTPTSFSPTTKKQVNQLLASEYWRETLDVTISVTARADHPYNAAWLDTILRPLKMADRDAWWSIYVFGKVGEEGNIYRLIEWGWAERKESVFSDEVVRLASLTLTWCLTASDRFVRDRATKALVSLLEERIPILHWLLDHFAGVEEPYLQERLYAAAYGCAMLTNQSKELQRLAQKIYDRIFRHGLPPASVLLRDHARGVIERATRTGLAIDYDPSLILPPYKSKWPKTPPPLSILEKRYKSTSYDETSAGLRRIFDSVTNDDFSRYVMGTEAWWSDRRRKGKASQDPKSLFKELLKKLSSTASETLTLYAKCMRDIYEADEDLDKTSGTENSSLRFVAYVDSHLNDILTKAQAALFRKTIVPFLKEPRGIENRREFKHELFERLILQRVLQLGWTVRHFNEFDRNVSENGREAHKAERIGKKYQWIAYDEMHARIDDNFGIAEKECSTIGDDEVERGTWPEHFRNIDPSSLLQNSPHDGWGENQRNWWTPHNYDKWMSAPTAYDWLQTTDDLPAPVDFLELTAQDNLKWMNLDSYTNWRRKEVVGAFSGREPDRQEIHYIFRSYLVAKQHLSAIMAWGQKQDWINDRLPSADSYHRVHLHEYYWSPHFDSPLEDDIITKVWNPSNLPHPVIQTTTDFSCENRGFDCSIDKGFVISVPSKWLARKMGLRVKGRRGDFVDSSGNTITFDPSTREIGHSTLLIQREALREFLERENLALIWTLLGEKNIYPPGNDRDRWLGRLTILGIYSWAGQQIAGNFRSEFFKGGGR